jgi:Flp pilus assembly protein TadD
MAWLISIRRQAVFLTPFASFILSGLILAGCQSGGSPMNDPRARQSAEKMEFSPEARLRVAAQLKAAGDYMSALRMYQDVIDADPKNLAGWLGQAELYQELGAPQQAAAVYRSALMVLPDAAQLDAGLGRALTEMGQGEEAIPYFERALAKGESGAKTHNHYGVALDLVGRHRDAQVQYGIAMDKSKGDLAAMNNLALSLALSEDYPAAVRLLSDLVTVAPNAVVARRNLALVYALSGDMKAADAMIRFPDNPAAEQSAQTYIKRMLLVPPELRAKAIFAGLEAVADDMPPPSQETLAAPVVAQQNAPVQKSTTPAVVDVTTRTNSGQVLSSQTAEPAIAQTTAPSAGPAAAEVAEEKSTVQTQTQDKAQVQAQAQAERVYFVQLGAYPTQALAKSGWEKLAAQAPALLNGRTAAFYPSDDLVRLGLPAADRNAARALCEELKEGGVDCLIRWTAAPDSGQ